MSSRCEYPNFAIALEKALPPDPFRTALISLARAGISIGILEPGQDHLSVIGPANHDGRWFVVIQDDPPEVEAALGPGGFDSDAVENCLRSAKFVCVYSGMAEEKYYRALAACAHVGLVLLILARVNHEEEWIALVRQKSHAAMTVISPTEDLEQRVVGRRAAAKKMTD